MQIQVEEAEMRCLEIEEAYDELKDELQTAVDESELDIEEVQEGDQ